MRFNNLKEAEEELKKVKMIQKYMAPDHIARSDEFLVDYIMDGKHKLILCGLQEYVNGEVLDPWSHLDKNHLASLSVRLDFEKTEDSDCKTDRWVRRVQAHPVDRHDRRDVGARRAV